MKIVTGIVSSTLALALTIAGGVVLESATTASAQAPATTTTAPSGAAVPAVSPPVSPAPFYDSNTLGGRSVVIGGQTLTPQTLACSTSTVSGSTTSKCIEVSSTSIYASGAVTAGTSFPGHMELVENGSLIANMPTSGEPTFGSHAYTVTESFPPASYCVYLWKYISSTDYLDMGDVCEVLS